MKKLQLLIVLWIFALPLMAQNTLTVSGTVTDIVSGAPIPNHEVSIMGDSTYGLYYYHVVVTNPNGFYFDSVPLSPSSSYGVIYISTVDCQGYNQTVTMTYSLPNLNLVHNFQICSLPPPDCNAQFIHQNTGPLTVQFTDQSIGGNGMRLWNFGDGSTSSLLNPVHTYPSTGNYVVNLTIGAQGTTCWDSETETIFVSDSTPNNCQAYFYAYPDELIPLKINFTNYSAGNLNTFIWNFGDGIVTTISFPGNPNVSHIYSQPGTYNACLTVIGFDSICVNTYCLQVVVQGGNTGCTAAFSYNHDPNTSPNMIHFVDASVSNGPVNWSWVFGEPAAGTSNYSNLQNPIHEYMAPGVYQVCLNISGNDSTCYDTFCQQIIVGDTIPSGCQAYYTFAPVSGTTPNVIQFTDASLYTGVVSWFWNFDDGTTSTEQNPVHVFPSGPVIDPYFVCLTISKNDSICYDTYCQPFIPENEGCHADFEAIPSPNSPLSINFVDHSQGGIWLWTWNFGDGDTLTVAYPNNPNVSHTYQSPGIYTVCLKIQGDYGLCNSTSCGTVAVYDSLPGCQAQFTHYPDSVSSLPNAVRFVDLSIGNATQWHWNFGDPVSGINNISTEQNPVHSFPVLGTYHVCLTIIDQENGAVLCQSTWCQEIEIGQPVNCANYFAYLNAGLDVSFNGYVLNSLPATYSWDFGDGQTGTGQSIVHNYAANGIYFVTLTSADASGCTATSSQSIVVGDSTNWNQIYGQVFAGDFPLGQGLVMLFSLDTTNAFVPFVDISFIDSVGIYYFPMVPQGNFVIYAIPFMLDYIPTYYGDVLNWQSATVITLGTANNPYNIHLLQPDSYIQGAGSISGQVNQGDISTTMIDKVTMLLKDASGKTISYNKVNEAGSFAFPQLDYGTYYLYAELAGCTTQNIKVEITSDNPTAEVSMTLNGHNILGVSGTLPSVESVVIYPVPSKEVANIKVTLPENNEMTIELFNMSGRMVYRNVTSVMAGESTLTIPLTNLANGIYQLSVIMQDGARINKKLIKTN